MAGKFGKLFGRGKNATVGAGGKVQGDVIEVDILEDGTIKFVTGQISAVNHATAESFFRTVEELAGNRASVMSAHKHTRGKEHEHQHEHDGHGHHHH